MSNSRTDVTRAELRTLGIQVRCFRKAAGLTLAQVATRSGLSRANLTRLENGIGARSPGLSTIKRLASAIGVKPSVLVSSLDHRSTVSRPTA